MICEITNRGTTFGHNVSHACNKTNRPFKINAFTRKIFSPALGRDITICVSNKGLRTLLHHGSIDEFLEKNHNIKSKKLRQVQKQIRNAKI